MARADLMEGVSSEAASLASHLKLGKLIYLYDDNHVTLSATDVTFTEDRARRFEAYETLHLAFSSSSPVWQCRACRLLSYCRLRRQPMRQSRSYAPKFNKLTNVCSALAGQSSVH
jgi:Transketolase, thiamine diphosphate binding domain